MQLGKYIKCRARRLFRTELADLRIYTGMLGEMAGVENDLVLLEQVEAENQNT